MVKSKDGRTNSERKYAPIRRATSRYGWIEKALTEMKEEGVKRFHPNEVAFRTKKLGAASVSRILAFTIGVNRIDVGVYEFDRKKKKIRVDSR